MAGRATTPRLNSVLGHYVPLPKEELADIWMKQKELRGKAAIVEPGLADDERVEDAGLEHNENN